LRLKESRYRKQELIFWTSKFESANQGSFEEIQKLFSPKSVLKSKKILGINSDNLENRKKRSNMMKRKLCWSFDSVGFQSFELIVYQILSTKNLIIFFPFYFSVCVFLFKRSPGISKIGWSHFFKEFSLAGSSKKNIFFTWIFFSSKMIRF